jgi:hypothetical protein
LRTRRNSVIARLYHVRSVKVVVFLSPEKIVRRIQKAHDRKNLMIWLCKGKANVADMKVFVGRARERR